MLVRSLDPAKIPTTAEHLERRVHERFPDRGPGLVALVRLEARVRRQRVAVRLHELRSVIRVIDMHRLTKDPCVLARDFRPTEGSPVRDLDAVGVSRYLDDCAELLADDRPDRRSGPSGEARGQVTE